MKQLDPCIYTGQGTTMLNLEVKLPPISWLMKMLYTLQSKRTLAGADEEILCREIKEIKKQINEFFEPFGLRIAKREDGGHQFCLVPEEFCLVTRYNSLDPEDYTLVFEDEEIASGTPA